MSRVAFLTFGVLAAEWGDAKVRGFVERIQESFDVAECSDGCIAVARNAPIGKVRFPETGEPDMPGFVGEEKHSRVAATLSLWEDLESVFAYAYGNFHAANLPHRKTWFEESAFPSYAAWWVGDDHFPRYSEVRDRHEYLHDNGPSPTVFTFKQPFTADGSPTVLDKAVIKNKIERNAARWAALSGQK